MAEGGGWDPCECICSHEGAMRRLLSLLRQAQSSCTDNQCFGTVPNPAGSDGGDGGMTVWALLILWLIIAILLYLFRPASMRQRAGKPIGNDEDLEPRPPAPPVQ
eukprot:m.12735 g.12735  ORF g.12735 m.12735 type:complete len:105 (+) comp24259_c0_seq2:68-382(+)